MKHNQKLKFIFFLSVLGILISGYLIYIHYNEETSICNLNETFSCSLVNKSIYSKIFNIPVAILGLIAYSFLAIISWSMKKKKFNNKKIIKKIISAQTILIFSIIALLFSFYLTYTEIFLIKKICIFCVISQIIILVITYLSYRIILSSKKVFENNINN